MMLKKSLSSVLSIKSVMCPMFQVCTLNKGILNDMCACDYIHCAIFLTCIAQSSSQSPRNENTDGELAVKKNPKILL